MKNKIHNIIFTILLLMQTLPVCAQPDFEDEVQDTPLDCGICLLATAGLIYGILKQNKIYRLKHDQILNLKAPSTPDKKGISQRLV